MEDIDRSSGWIGTVLQDKWRIVAKIARGGVATVFRAEHRHGQRAAIKIMLPQFCRNEDVRRRFLREGYAANKVGHPGVVRVIDDDVTPSGSPYIVMELLEDGENLEDRRVRLGGRLPADEVVRVCDQVLDVLAAAHDKGIIHRDIKPENVFLKNDGTVKVLDFGIAHIKESVLEHEPTATGILLGTPEFMAPEQAVGKRGTIDARTDVYALGATMFTLLSGEAVHVHDNLSALLIATSTRQARSLASVAFKGIPRELVAVVDKALALEKARRWQSARAMQEALRKAMPEAFTATDTPATPSADAPPTREQVSLLPPPKPATVLMPPPARSPTRPPPPPARVPPSLSPPARAESRLPRPTPPPPVVDEVTTTAPRNLRPARARPASEGRDPIPSDPPSPGPASAPTLLHAAPARHGAAPVADGEVVEEMPTRLAPSRSRAEARERASCEEEEGTDAPTVALAEPPVARRPAQDRPLPDHHPPRIDRHPPHAFEEDVADVETRAAPLQPVQRHYVPAPHPNRSTLPLVEGFPPHAASMAPHEPMPPVAAYAPVPPPWAARRQQPTTPSRQRLDQQRNATMLALVGLLAVVVVCAWIAGCLFMRDQ